MERSVLTIIAATKGRWLLELIMQVSRAEQGAGIQMLAGDTSIDILTPYKETTEAKRAIVHMAMECNAPVHELDWEDIAFDKAGIAQAYDALMELLSEFNDQMRVATGDCMSTPYSIAKKGHTAAHGDASEPMGGGCRVGPHGVPGRVLRHSASAHR